jgi:hypothetical protein
MAHPLYIHTYKPLKMNPWLKYIRELRFEVLVRVALKITVCWVIMPSNSRKQKSD